MWQTQKLKWWQNSKTETETKHKIFKCDNIQNSNCDKTKKENCDKTQNSNCDKTQKLKLRQNFKTQIVTKLKNPNWEKLKKTLILTKLKKSNCDKTKKNLNCGQNQELKMWQN